MEIKWNEGKSRKLKTDRGISFEELIGEGEIIDVIDNPSRENQKRFIVQYSNYIYSVPFVANGDEIFLKTLFPSRKLKKQYLK